MLYGVVYYVDMEKGNYIGSVSKLFKTFESAVLCAEKEFTSAKESLGITEPLEETYDTEKGVFRSMGNENVIVVTIVNYSEKIRD